MRNILRWAGAGFKTVAVVLVTAVVTAAVIFAVRPVQLTSTPTPTPAPTVSPTEPAASPTGPRCPTEDSCVVDYRGGRWHIAEVTP